MIDQPPNRVVADRNHPRHQLVGYIVVGSTSYLVDVGLLVLARSVFRAPLWLATTLGFWTSILVNFALNRWLFRSSGRMAGHVLRYAALLGVNFGLTLVIVYAFVAAGSTAVIGKIVAAALMTTWNYWLYRRLVFV